MSRLLLRGAAVLGGALVPDAVVACEHGVVVWSGPWSAWQPDGWPQPQRLPDEHTLLPGLVDLHCHGAVGFDFAAAGSATDPGAEGAALAAAYHRSNGTTSVVASIVSGTDVDTRRAIVALSPLVDDGVLAGLHLEGPYLSPVRCGAHDPALLREPDLAELEAWLELADGRIVHMTIAPELPGAAAAAELVRQAGATAAVGHTDADHQAVAEALSAAAAAGRPGLVTHLFNAMRPLHHRSPGPVAAALAAAAHGEAVLELIADGVHLDDALAATVVDLVGAGQVALVTDAMAATGCGDGDYVLGGRPVRVSGGTAKLAGAAASGSSSGEPVTDDVLAGGTRCLLDVVRRCAGGPVPRAGTAPSLVDVITAASATPARVLTQRTGARPNRTSTAPTAGAGPAYPLSPGSPADLLVVDAGLSPVKVAVAGQWKETSVTPGCAEPLRG
jgi:N-acetylglucosamine-6-phosphate deacetylase